MLVDAKVAGDHGVFRVIDARLDVHADNAGVESGEASKGCARASANTGGLEHCANRAVCSADQSKVSAPRAYNGVDAPHHEAASRNRSLRIVGVGRDLELGGGYDLGNDAISVQRIGRAARAARQIVDSNRPTRRITVRLGGGDDRLRAMRGGGNNAWTREEFMETADSHAKAGLAEKTQAGAIA